MDCGHVVIRGRRQRLNPPQIESCAHRALRASQRLTLLFVILLKFGNDAIDLIEQVLAQFAISTFAKWVVEHQHGHSHGLLAFDMQSARAVN